MKKILYFLVFLSLFLTGCSNNSNIIDNITTDESGTNEEAKSNLNIAVIYFSATNNTENVATIISNYLDCELFEIVPSIPYTSADLNYNNSDCRANQEQNNPNSRPEITNSIVVEKYNTIFIGYPIWWGKLPKIIHTFFDDYDLCEYTIIPFCTSGGSSIQTSVSEIKNLEPIANVLDGRRFSSNISNEEVIEWLKSLDLNVKEENIDMKIEIIIDDVSMIATLDDNPSAKEFYEHIKENNLTLKLEEYGGFEYVGPLGFSLTRNDESINTNPGDIILYNGNQISIMYGSNSWSYTKLGKIDTKFINNLNEIFKNSDVVITIKVMEG